MSNTTKKVKTTTEKPEIKKATAEAVQPEATPQSVNMYVTPKDPVVKILYLDSSIPNNEIPIGGGRSITGSGRIFNVTLTDFEGTFMTAFIQKLIRRKKLIILDGLTEEQREMYGCNYGENEIIRSEGMFDALLNMPVSEMARIFSALCPEHRNLVAKRFISAYEKGDNRLSRDRIEALNKISKADYADGKGAFTAILRAMNDNI